MNRTTFGMKPANIYVYANCRIWDYIVVQAEQTVVTQDVIFYALFHLAGVERIAQSSPLLYSKVTAYWLASI